MSLPFAAGAFAQVLFNGIAYFTPFYTFILTWKVAIKMYAGDCRVYG